MVRENKEMMKGKSHKLPNQRERNSAVRNIFRELVVMNSQAADWFAIPENQEQIAAASKSKAMPIDSSHLFSESARRVLFFAKYAASLRDTDSVTHHITVADLLAGIRKEDEDQILETIKQYRPEWLKDRLRKKP
jgi:hypothetical protein